MYEIKSMSGYLWCLAKIKAFKGFSEQILKVSESKCVSQCLKEIIFVLSMYQVENTPWKYNFKQK